MSAQDAFAGPYRYDAGDPDGYRGARGFDSREHGDGELVVRVYELPPGESLCPYHYEYVEEWLLLHDGELELRTPRGTERLLAGAIARFPAGPEGAHKVSAQGSAPAHFVMFSSAREPAVAVYPDSDKIGVWPGRDEDHVILRRADGHVDYYEGET